MSTLADTTTTIAAWAATIVVLLLVAAVFWSFLRRRGTVDGLTIESPADAVRRDRLAAAEADPDAAPVEPDAVAETGDDGGAAGAGAAHDVDAAEAPGVEPPAAGGTTA